MKSHRFGARRVLAISAAGAVTVGLASGAGGAAAQPAASASASQLTILAAASLSKVFPKINKSPRYTFAGSGMLETEIMQGAKADVFAAASPKQPAALFTAGLVYKPVEFATNTLVMIVPKDNPAHIKSVSDITKKGVKIVVCNSTVPCGDYASTAFANLGITAAATKNIVSQETDVTQVVAQIAAGEGDVGFVYITDAKAAGSKVKAIRLPAKAKPGTEDVVAVVKSTSNKAGAQAFVKALLSKSGQATLKAAGFGKP
ncbi:MAG TPA: molybdate ABC transporter substrate-binding protein [Solirubrobacteraceae bacterium]|nr:molybdate ABC transporter substrate-binding protein [Solirubrobacteraceae bacterium]